MINRLLASIQKLVNPGILLMCAWLAFPPATAMSQDALKDRVIQLIEKLDASDNQQAKSAEDALIKLGTKILPHLPESSGKPESANRDIRLKRIRTTLEAGPKTNPEASIVTIQGDSIRLSDALKS
ncbi:MAG: hypothetical protein NT172_08715, partial [Planctomycetota bacterium]|nr:hypothetical protein [Planctomycetota bacterium]